MRQKRNPHPGITLLLMRSAAQLRMILESEGLPTTGRKLQMARRLEKHRQAQAIRHWKAIAQ